MSRRWYTMQPVGAHYGIISRLFIFIFLVGCVLVVATTCSHQPIIQ